MSKANGNSKRSPQSPPSISTISVAGFKSISDAQTIQIRPLTLLAGVNSSGKSSMIQPLLLLKQTLEAPFDPGSLLIDGPSAKFTSVTQFWPVESQSRSSGSFAIAIGLDNEAKVAVAFGRDEKQKALGILSTTYSYRGRELKLPEDQGLNDSALLHKLTHFDGAAPRFEHSRKIMKYQSGVRQSRCFLELVGHVKSSFAYFSILSPLYDPFKGIIEHVMETIHLPGLRGNPERSYPVSAIGGTFPGTFENYVASVIAHWTAESPIRVKEVGEDLRLLGLTWRIEAKPVTDTQVEIHVGRTPLAKRAGAKDLVSIADVGFGVSQTLPVVVALRGATWTTCLY